MRLALCPFNPTIGDFEGNVRAMAELAAEARTRGAEVVVFPELAVSGYPPRDLLMHEGFVAACAKWSKRLGEGESAGVTLIFGTPLPAERDGPGTPSARSVKVANSLVVYRDGRFIDYYDKRLLPTYDVFDEDRYFTPGTRSVCIETADNKHIGLAICEDLWQGEDAGFASRYAHGPKPIDEVVAAGASLLISPSASPFVLGKPARHIDVIRAHARRHNVTIASVNQLGGNDDLVFDGHAVVIGPDGRIIAGGNGLRDEVVMVDLSSTDQSSFSPRLLSAPNSELLFEVLSLGIRDYVRKTGFRNVLLGVSGGIDSAVVAALAKAALGSEHVLGVAMPGKYSSQHALDDACQLAERLGISFLETPIAPPFDGFRESLDHAFHHMSEPTLGESLPDIAEENLQSRVRGTTLMAISNRTGALLLTTGNKSELAVGYCTLYGDMNGGLAVLSDVTKNNVYALARWMNEHFEQCGFASPPIPENTITKPPSAELAPDQKDEDSLPAYDVLDEIVRRYVEEKESIATIVEQTGFDPDETARIVRLIEINEYKRRQVAIGIKVTDVAFGSGRRVPIAKRWNA